MLNTISTISPFLFYNRISFKVCVSAIRLANYTHVSLPMTNQKRKHAICKIDKQAKSCTGANRYVSPLRIRTSAKTTINVSSRLSLMKQVSEVFKERLFNSFPKTFQHESRKTFLSQCQSWEKLPCEAMTPNAPSNLPTISCSL